MTSTFEGLEHIIEAAIMVAGHPLSKADILKLFDESEQPSAGDIQEAITKLQEKYHNDSGVELREVASGFQFQAKTEYSPWLGKLWEDRPARYSRAYLETLALIAYRQPITRAEIEDIRGVAVSSNIVKTLVEREWVKVIGHKDVPGKPALYGTTKTFLDHFNLKTLDQLPSLAEIKDMESQEANLQVELELAHNHIKPLENANDSESTELEITEITAESETIENDSDLGTTTDESDTIEHNSDMETIITDESEIAESDSDFEESETQEIADGSEAEGITAATETVEDLTDSQTEESILENSTKEAMTE